MYKLLKCGIFMIVNAANIQSFKIAKSINAKNINILELKFTV